MLKRIFAFILVLSIILGGLVGYQWLIYEKNFKKMDKIQNENIEIEATITHKNGILLINEKVSNLRQRSFVIKVPSEAVSLVCDVPNEECIVNNEPPFQRVNLGNQSSVSFTYEIPIAEKESSKWFDNILIQFLRDDLSEINSNYNVVLSEEEDKSITWIAGAINQAQIDKEHLSYYAWTKNETTVFPLYMTKAPVQKVGTFEPNLFLYDASNGENNFGEFNSLSERLPEQSGLSIVSSNEKQVYLAPLLLVVPIEMKMNQVEELAVQAYLLNFKQPKSKEISWVWNLLPAFILNRPVGEGKEYEMSVELIENLRQETRETIAKWLLAPTKKAQMVDLNDLDAQLSKAAKLKTSFFTNNQKEMEDTIPLYFNDDRPIFGKNGKVSKDLKAILRNNTIQIPITEVMELLGFSIQSFTEEGMYLITQGGNSWRFYLDKTYFIYNQEDYGLMNRPLEFINKKAYISEQMLEDIFKIDVIKRDDGIYFN